MWQVCARMCALSGWLDAAPLISPLETFHNENARQWDAISFLIKKYRPGRVLRTEWMQGLFVFVVVSSTKHFIISFGVNKQKRKVRQVLCRPYGALAYSDAYIRRGSQLVRGNKGLLCKPKTLNRIPGPTQHGAAWRDRRTWRICIFLSMRWICLSCGLCDGEVMRSSVGDGGKCRHVKKKKGSGTDILAAWKATVARLPLASTHTSTLPSQHTL